MSKQCNCVRCTSLSGDGHVSNGPCPKNFKSIGKVCLWENPNLSITPIIDSLSGNRSKTGTEFPSPRVPITKPKSRLTRDKSLTELFGDSF